MKANIKFAEEKLKETLAKLKTSKTEDQNLYVGNPLCANQLLQLVG